MRHAVRLTAVSLLASALTACGSPSSMPPPPSAPTPIPAKDSGGTPISGNCNIGFDGLTIQGAVLGTHVACGLTITATAANWTASTAYGAPAPFVLFRTPAGLTEDGEITVRAADGSFAFLAVDLYSSTTKIPWRFTGLRGDATTFSASGAQPNTFGNFATVANPHASAAIDTLRIRLTNPSAPCCPNPMGLDNLRVVR